MAVGQQPHFWQTFEVADRRSGSFFLSSSVFSFAGLKLLIFRKSQYQQKPSPAGPRSLPPPPSLSCASNQPLASRPRTVRFERHTSCLNAPAAIRRRRSEPSLSLHRARAPSSALAKALWSELLADGGGLALMGRLLSSPAKVRNS